MSYHLAIEVLAANAFLFAALLSVRQIALVIGRSKPTAALSGMVVLVALVGAAPAPAAPDNTGMIPLTLVKVRSPVARGDQMRLVAVVFPDRARCTIAVDNKNGATHEKGLNPKWPALGGRLAWKWEVGADAALGRWSILVDCGALGSLRTHFRVVR